MSRLSRPLILVAFGLGLLGLLIQFARVGSTSTRAREPEAGSSIPPRADVRPGPSLESSRSRETADPSAAADYDRREERTGLAFTFSDGRPASGLRLYSAEVPSANWTLALHDEVPRWQHVLDPAGRLAAGTSFADGATLAIRMCDAAVETVCIESARTRPYELPPIRPQTFVVSGGPGDADFGVELELRSVDVDLCGQPDGLQVSSSGPPFADRYSVRAAKAADRPALLALVDVKIDSKLPAPAVDLPNGSYRVITRRCSIGWWPTADRIELAGGSTSIGVASVPVTDAVLPKREDGRVREPVSVRLFVADARPGEARSSGEIELPFEIVGDRLRVSERWRTTEDETYTTYGLIVYWSDGTSTSTKVGAWQQLLGITEIGNP
jgi:hypothetical protein